MFARYVTVRADPSKIEALAERVDGETRDAIEAQPGSRGFTVLTDIPGGRMLGASYWDDLESARRSDDALAANREQSVAAVGGSLSVQPFEVALAFRRSFPTRGAPVRLTRSMIDPARLEEGLALAREEVLPRVKGADGLCTYLLLVDRQSGAGVTVTAWENQAAADAFAPVAEQIRAQVSERVGVVFEQPETFTMVRTTVQLD